MKLTKVRITNFQSIQDSTEFDIDDITCLVGKNEAGKTALLRALYRLNPINEEDGNFDVMDDYPRQTVTDYEHEVATARREPAEVVRATYSLEPDDIATVEEVFGSGCLKDKVPCLTLHKGYSNELKFCSFAVDDEPDKAHMVDNQILLDRIPKFLYFDEYYQMKGQDNVDALKQRVASNVLDPPDHPLLGLIHLAGLDLEQISNTTRTESLIARLEAAGNSLTQRVLPYWSQNQHLRMKFDIRPAQSEDPEGMTSGTNIWARVEDMKHMVSTALGTRSRGFVWFFSFLAWYQELRRENENLILLLDEPGLFLHAKAQGDLLRYFKEELMPHHQLIYTTHSPFMVDSAHFDRVRIVQDLSIEPDSDNLPDDQQGTKVITDVLKATPDSLFPLQGALGYEIYQPLFVGPNCLVVEGVSDLLYIQTVSALLQKKDESGLSAEWTITPVGGSDKIPTFVALIGAQTNLNVAVLIDYQNKDRQSIENLYKRKLLKQQQVLTYADFVGGDEADVEDMFAPEFYLKLANSEFGISLTVDDLPEGSPRIVRRIEQYFENNPIPNGVQFNHYRPARYFSENIESLESELTEEKLNRFQQVFTDLNKLLDVT